MTNLFCGELSEEWEKNWGAGNEPFDVLKKMICIDGFFPSEHGWSWTNKYCTDEVQVDWGSWAWKCKGRALIELNGNSSSSHDEMLEALDPEKTYGVVLIEIY